METLGEESSQIKEFLTDSTIFLTGGTGFLGKLLIEKILRTCPNIKKMYILIREKKGKNVKKRFEEMLDTLIFKQLKADQFDFYGKLEVIQGDTYLPNLGVKDEDVAKLVSEVTCIFHCAATVRFNEKIRIAAHINVRTTRDLIGWAKQMKHLNSFVYISTAYSNCIYEEVKEQFYDSAMTGENFLQLVDSVDDNFLETVAPTIIGKWPNTYTFSKSIAEAFVKNHGFDLPIAIIRPSIIISTQKEPFPGWIDNVYGPTGVLSGVGAGLIRTTHCIREYNADMVPADMVINCAIAAAWDVHNSKIKKGKVEFDELSPIPIYNYVNYRQNPIKWTSVMKLTELHGICIPPIKMIWYPLCMVNSTYFMHMVWTLLLHHVPAYIVDFIAYAMGKQPILVKGYKKIDKFLDVLSYFGSNQWNFRNENTEKLWNRLNKTDQNLYNFDISSFDWLSYFPDYTRGARVYLLKDPMETVPKALKKMQKLKLIHYALVSTIFLSLFSVIGFTFYVSVM